MTDHQRPTILVIGGSGAVGSEIIAQLTKQGYRVRTTTSKTATTDLLGIEQVTVNLSTGDGLTNAFDGIERAFFLSPAGYADQYKILAPLIQAAVRHRLTKVVLMTAMGANAVESSPLRRAEADLEASGLNYNIIRPNWFMQNFHTFWLHGIRSLGKIQLPAGQAKVSFIDARDIAEVAAKLLVADDLRNRAFDLTGEEAVDHAQVAKVIAKTTGRSITYDDITPEELRRGLIAASLPDDYSDFLVTILGSLRAGAGAWVTGSVREILGRAPRGLEQYASDNKQAWL